MTKIKCRVCDKEFDPRPEIGGIGDRQKSNCPDCQEKRKCSRCMLPFEINRDNAFEHDCPPCRKAEKEKYEKQAREELRARRLSRIPEKYQKLNTDKLDLLESKMDRSLFITGKQGVGKTVFMYSLARKYIDLGKDLKIIRLTSWIMELQATYRNNGENPFIMAKEVAEFSGTLFIDDLGAEKSTEYIRQILYYIFDEREQRELKTVITSNMSLKEIDEAIDPRTSSRIAGMCEVLIFKGEDRRIRRELK